jgi:hypothetical protein
MYALSPPMKAVVEKRDGRADDFYISTLAPVDRQRDTRFGVLDGTMLTVLFVELVVFMRLFLAN